MASHFPGPSRRARGGGGRNQPVTCLVDGCNSDLSTCRDYHRRHKVCELHSKASEVTIGGLKRRFCQQCSRFHSLEEFDEGKRSCRKRLEGHNRRRRKPQRGPLPQAGSPLSYHHGSLTTFPGLHIHPSTAVNRVRSGVLNAEADGMLHNQHQLMNMVDKQNFCLLSSPSESNYQVGQQLAVWRGISPIFSDQTSVEASLYHPLFRNIAPSESGGDGSKMSYEEFKTPVHELDCALSLLSSPQAPEICFSHLEQHNTILLRPPPSSLGIHPNSSDTVDSILVSSVTNSTVNCPETFCASSDGIGKEGPPTHSFHWE